MTPLRDTHTSVIDANTLWSQISTCDFHVIKIQMPWHAHTFALPLILCPWRTLVCNPISILTRALFVCSCINRSAAKCTLRIKQHTSASVNSNQCIAYQSSITRLAALWRLHTSQQDLSCKCMQSFFRLLKLHHSTSCLANFARQKTPCASSQHSAACKSHTVARSSYVINFLGVEVPKRIQGWSSSGTPL